MKHKIAYAADISETYILQHAATRRAKSKEYAGITDNMVRAAFCRAIGYNLRYDCKANVMRDSSGWLSMPSNPSEWPEASIQDAQGYIAQHIWCDAVGAYNRRKQAA